MIGWVMFGLGATVCVVNFYLSWLRYPLHRVRGGDPRSYQRVSGLPLVGSLLVMGSWALWLHGVGSVALDVTAWAIALIDTGGIHWFLGVMVVQWVRTGGRASA